MTDKDLAVVAGGVVVRVARAPFAAPEALGPLAPGEALAEFDPREAAPGQLYDAETGELTDPPLPE